jgi:hypothetical protein
MGPIWQSSADPHRKADTLLLPLLHLTELCLFGLEYRLPQQQHPRTVSPKDTPGHSEVTRTIGKPDTKVVPSRRVEPLSPEQSLLFVIGFNLFPHCCLQTIHSIR